MMMKESKTLITCKNKSNLEEILAFLNTLDENSKYALLNFFQGAKFMKNLITKKEQ
jgi:hypothetical protein